MTGLVRGIPWLASIADLDKASNSSVARHRYATPVSLKATAGSNRAATGIIAVDLPRWLRLPLRGGGLFLLALGVTAAVTVTRRDRLLVLHLLAFIVVVDAR